MLIRVKIEMNGGSELSRTFTAAGHEERAWDFDGLYLVPMYRKARGFQQRDERLQFFRVNEHDGRKSSDAMSVRAPFGLLLVSERDEMATHCTGGERRLRSSALLGLASQPLVSGVDILSLPLQPERHRKEVPRAAHCGKFRIGNHGWLRGGPTQQISAR